MRHSKKKVLSMFLALLIAISVVIIMPKQDTKADTKTTSKKSELVTDDKVKELMVKEFSKASAFKFSQDKYKKQLEKRYSNFKAGLEKAKGKNNPIEKIEFSFDKEKWLTYTEPVKVDGNRKFYGKITDYAGNVTYGEVNITNINKDGKKTESEEDKDKKDDGKAVDEKGNPLPKTGSPINFTVLGIAGAVLIVAGGVFVFHGKKRKKSADKKE